MMGMANWLQWFSWYFKYFVFFFFITFFMSLILTSPAKVSINLHVYLFKYICYIKSLNIIWYNFINFQRNLERIVLANSNFTLIWFFFLLYGMALTSFCFVISAIFNRGNF